MSNRSLTAAVAAIVLAGSAAVLTACSEKADEAPVAAPVNTAAPGAGAPIASGNALNASQENAGSIASRLTSGVCSVENVVTIPDETASPGERPNSYVATRDKGYRLVGFAVNKDGGTVAPRLDLLLVGVDSYSVPVDTGRPRGDVADYFKNPAFDKAGYMVDVSFEQVRPGDYAIYFVERGDGAAGAVCSTNQSLTVR